MNTFQADNLSLHEKQLEQLLSAKPEIKYSDWLAEDTHRLSLQAGVYHFFEKLSNGDIASLYVGKASFTHNGWSLYKRLLQHFQNGDNGLLGEASKKYKCTPQQMKSNFNMREIYLQWLPIHHRQSSETLDSAAYEMQNREIIFCEHFCVSLLHPEFNDG